MPDLLWDDGLALVAQEFADKCIYYEQNWDREDRFQELGGSSNFAGNPTYIGETLAYGDCSPTSCLSMSLWEEQALLWNYTASGGVCAGTVEVPHCSDFTQVLVLYI